MVPKELFLSHAGADQKFAESVVKVLRKHGIPLWYSPVHVVGGQEWHDEIGNALRRCDWFAVILSPDSLQSMWVKRELNYVLRQERMDGRIIPVMCKPCDVDFLSWTLPASQFVDFTRSFTKGCRDLLRIWDINYRKS